MTKKIGRRTSILMTGAALATPSGSVVRTVMRPTCRPRSSRAALAAA
jgi:hypothetical protein